jgi:hypothetical protein
LIWVSGRAAQGVHGHFQPAVQVPGVQVVQLLLQLGLPLAQFFKVGVRFGKLVGDGVEFRQQIHRLLYTFLDDQAHGFILIQERFLLQIAHRVAGGEHCLAVEFLVHASHDPEQRTLARPVQPQDADLRAVKIGERYILDDRFLVIELADPHHGIDNFIWFDCHAGASSYE